MAVAQLDADGRYIFRFALAELPESAESPDFEEYAQRLLASLLSLVELTSDGKPVEADGFRLRREDLAAKPPRPIFPQGDAEPARAIDLLQTTRQAGPAVVKGRVKRQGKHAQLLSSVRASEPRIHMLAEHLDALLTLIVPEADGEPVAVDGFRLKDLDVWRVPSGGDPSEVYEHLSRVCNIKCEFCYLHANPDDLAIGKAQRSTDLEELRTRLDFFDPAGGTALFRSQWEINEFLVHPHAREIFERLRERTDQQFFFITNGGPLTPEVVDMLRRVRPVFLIVSVNTIDVDTRVRVMHDRQHKAETAIKSVELLSEAGIPFGASIVMWPNIGLDSLERTLEYLERFRPAFVRVNLPGYTKNTPAAIKPDMDTPLYWADVVREVIRLRPKFATPIFAIPHMFEELIEREPNQAHVLGSIPGSPAADAGVLAGDVIRKINGMPVLTRNQALSTIWMLRDRPIQLELERNGAVVRAALEPNGLPDYPDQGDLYGKYLFPRGVVLPPSLGISQIQEVRRAVERHDARHVLIVTSKLMQRAVADLLDRYGDERLRTTRRSYCIAENHYLGGNIRIMDMCAVSDFIRAIRSELAGGDRPDCVIIPDSAFNDWGRDLVGEWRGAIQRAVGIPVEFIKTTRFAF